MARSRCHRRHLTERAKARTQRKLKSLWWLYASEPTRMRNIRSRKPVPRRINKRTYRERY
jgi:hypothetical protein